MRLSGLQKEVLSLYRSCIRECRKKPVATRKNFQVFARQVSAENNIPWLGGEANGRARTEFEKNLKIDKRDFSAIEFLLRKGRRQLEMYASPGVKDIK